VTLAERGPARLLERAADDAAQHVAVDQVLAALGQLHEVRERIILPICATWMPTSASSGRIASVKPASAYLLAVYAGMLRSGMRPAKLFTMATTGFAPRLAAASSAGTKPAYE